MLDQLMIKKALISYLKILRFKFINILQWRTELVIWILLDILPFSIMIFVWKAIFGENVEIQQTSFSDVVLFYFLVIIIQGLTSVHFEEYRPTEIRMGRIDFFLVKPYSYLKELVVNDVAAKFLFIILFTPVMILFYRYLSLFTPFSLPYILFFILHETYPIRYPFFFASHQPHVFVRAAFGQIYACGLF